MLVTRLIPGNTLFHLLLAQVSKKTFDANVPNTLIPKDVPSKAISRMDHRAIGREGKKYGGDANGTVVTVSAIKTGNGYSRNILLDTRE